MTLPAVFDTLRLPVIGSPLFIISGPELVIAQCKAGIVGSFPALNARPQSQLDEWLHQIREALASHDRDHPNRPAAPYAVNQIVHKSNERLEQDLETCAKHKVPITITSLGAREELNTAVHAWGGIVLHDVINDRFAHKAIEKGADGLIPVAAGAGGHAGTLVALCPGERDPGVVRRPGGAVGRDRQRVVHPGRARLRGRPGLYRLRLHRHGRRRARPKDYKSSIAQSRADDIVYTNLFTGVHGNYLRGSIVAAGLDPDALPVSDPSAMNFGSSGNQDKKAWRDIWGSGQGIGSVRDVGSVADTVERLTGEYEAAKARLASVG